MIPLDCPGKSLHLKILNLITLAVSFATSSSIFTNSRDSDVDTLRTNYSSDTGTLFREPISASLSVNGSPSLPKASQVKATQPTALSASQPTAVPMSRHLYQGREKETVCWERNLRTQSVPGKFPGTRAESCRHLHKGRRLGRVL